MAAPTKNLILVIGTTGGQGMAVIDKLLAPAEDGSPSPYAVRALTRDPNSRRAKELVEKHVELFQGSFDEFPRVRAVLDGVWGIWANTDGFTVGEAKEMHVGMRIFESPSPSANDEACRQKGGFDPIYKCEHYDGKGRVADWLKAQPSILMFGPIATYALEDLGFFARYAFDHRAAVSGKDLEVASDWVGWDDLVATFTKVTGEKAEYFRQPLEGAESWFGNWLHTDHPAANERTHGDGSMTWRESFTGFWVMWRDDVNWRDWAWIRKTNPRGYTLESWMRARGYRGLSEEVVLPKNMEDEKSVVPNHERIRELLRS